MATESKRNGFKIIWAIDGLQDDPKGFENTRQVLKALATKLEAAVVPVFVLTPDPVNIDPEHFPDWSEVYRPSAQRGLAYLLRDVRIPNLATPKVLLENSPSLRAAAARLVRFAKTERADLILINTHARKGLSKLFLGSFCESVLNISSIPVLALNPSVHGTPMFKNIVFATDFSNAAQGGLRTIAKLACGLGARLTLFCKVLAPVPAAAFQELYIAEYSKAQTDEVRRRAKRWQTLAEKEGVRSVSTIIEEGGGTVVQAVQKIAKARPGIIAVSSRSGRVASALLGSIARELFRSSTSPVWVVHSK